MTARQQGPRRSHQREAASGLGRLPPLVLVCLGAARLQAFVGAAPRRRAAGLGLPPLRATAAAEAPARTEAWEGCVSALVESIEDCTPEDAEAWLLEGFAWTRKSKRFWRTSRVKAEPESPDELQGVLQWLKANDLATKKWVSKFPEVVGLSQEELEESKRTAPSYLRTDKAFFQAVRANPSSLGKNYDCLAEHESCQGRCSRCWNS